MLLKQYEMNGLPNNELIQKFLNENPNHTHPVMKVRGYKVSLPTIPTPEFPIISTAELQKNYDDQYSFVERAVKTMVDYGMLTGLKAQKTLEFYKMYYVYDDIFVMDKHALMNELIRSQAIANQDKVIFAEQKPHTNFNTKVISLENIRLITGYSYTPEIRGVETEVTWQKTLLSHAHNPDIHTIIVDGSRQMGKSKTISEILTESSFLPKFHQLVVAPSYGLTKNIKNYIKEYISNFDETLFEVHAKDDYILNTFSGSRIHFLTLGKQGMQSRGLTLHRVIIEEAQLVDNDVVIKVLKPTLTTTNGQIIAIGTACENVNSYMYTALMDAKRGNNEITYLTVSADDNPFITDTVRREIKRGLDNPLTRDSYLQEYYNKWGGGGNRLFSLQFADSFVPNYNGTLIISHDPARKGDKSAFSLHEVTEGRIITFLSGQIPEQYKHDWTLQRKYLMDIRNKYSSLYHKTITVIDGTGVGDGVVTIMETGGYSVSYVIKYTNSDTISVDGKTFRVGKTLLINNALDLMSTGVHFVIDEGTVSLQEEVSYATSSFDGLGRQRMNSTFFDDEINAMLIGLFISTKLNIHTRPTRGLSDTTVKDFKNEIERAYGKPRRIERRQRSNYF